MQPKAMHRAVQDTAAGACKAYQNKICHAAPSGVLVPACLLWRQVARQAHARVCARACVRVCMRVCERMGVWWPCGTLRGAWKAIPLFSRGRGKGGGARCTAAARQQADAAVLGGATLA